MSTAPRLPDVGDFKTMADVERWARGMTRILQDVLERNSTPAGSGYLAQNFTATRTIDAATAGLPEAISLLSTLVDDLKRGKQGTILA